MKGRRNESDSLSLRFLYRTVAGRSLLKLLVQPPLSRAAGRFLDTRASRVLIPGFLRKNQITLDDIAVPEGGFASFNDCFHRKRRETVFDPAPEHLCSPCDALLSCYPIDAKSRFAIKQSSYSLAELLDDPALAQRFCGGTALIFRLTPAHYHRYCYIDAGTVLKEKRIEGELHCVRPIALAQYPVFSRNAREYVLFRSEHFGDLIQMEIGALLVGKIVTLPRRARQERGEERGYFAFGGSTIVLLLPPGAAQLRAAAAEAAARGEELPVRQGEWIATAKEGSANGAADGNPAH